MDIDNRPNRYAMIEEHNYVVHHELQIADIQNCAENPGFVLVERLDDLMAIQLQEIVSSEPAQAAAEEVQIRPGCLLCSKQISVVSLFGSESESCIQTSLSLLTNKLTTCVESVTSKFDDCKICENCSNVFLHAADQATEMKTLLKPLVRLEAALANLTAKLRNFLESLISSQVLNSESLNETEIYECPEQEIQEKDSDALHSNKSALESLSTDDISISLFYLPLNKSATAESQNAGKVVSFPSSNEEDTGKTNKISGTAITCNICKKVLRNKSLLQSHMLIHTNETPLQCDICQRKFRHKSSLSLHKKRHEGKRSNKCKSCDKCFLTKQELHAHEKSHTNYERKRPGRKPQPKPMKNADVLQCRICKKFLSCRQLLKGHMLIHTEEKPYECSICFQKFRHNSSLFLHKKRHGGDLPYSCTTCPKKFLTKTQKEAHEGTHTPIADRVKNLLCQYCPKTFANKQHLGIHLMRCHPESRNLGKYDPAKLPKCSVCDSSFLTPLELKRHFANAHAPETREFVCDQCGVALASHFSLNRHVVVVHNKTKTEVTKNHACAVCDKRFDRPSALRHHSEIHEHKRPTVDCQVCGKAVKPRSMKSHLKTHEMLRKKKGKKKLLDKYNSTVTPAQISENYQLSISTISSTEDD